MQELFSSNLALYIVTMILTVLFLLQIWAILRIKEMLRQVVEIFRFMRAGSLASMRSVGEKQNSYQRICENCRYRKTYITNDSEFEIYYLCKKHNKEILLNESCYFFEYDEQNKEI